MPKITKLRLHLLKLFPENYWLLFFLDTVYNQKTWENTNAERISSLGFSQDERDCYRISFNIPRPRDVK